MRPTSLAVVDFDRVFKNQTLVDRFWKKVNKTDGCNEECQMLAVGTSIIQGAAFSVGFIIAAFLMKALLHISVLG